MTTARETSAPWRIAEVRDGGYVAYVSDGNQAPDCRFHLQRTKRYSVSCYAESDEHSCRFCGARTGWESRAIWGFFDDPDAAIAWMRAAIADVLSDSEG